MSISIGNDAVSSRTIWIGRILSGLAVAFLLFDGAIKLVPLQPVIDASAQFDIPVQYARTLGILTLICTILYAYPRTSVLGAVLLTGYLGGAIWTHMRIGSPLFSHTLFGVYLAFFIWGGLYLREPRLREIFPLRR
jgi:hypothetical protein